MPAFFPLPSHFPPCAPLASAGESAQNVARFFWPCCCVISKEQSWWTDVCRFQEAWRVELDPVVLHWRWQVGVAVLVTAEPSQWPEGPSAVPTSMTLTSSHKHLFGWYHFCLEITYFCVLSQCLIFEFCELYIQALLVIKFPCHTNHEKTLFSDW